MDGPVLVAYATKHGATREIAAKIGQVLTQEGLEVQVTPAEDVSTVALYRSVVLGSAVYAGKWRQEAAQFLKSNADALAERPVWLFSSGPTGEGDPVELMEGWDFPEDLKPVAERIQPRDITFFHGVLDEDALGLGEKLVVKAIRAPMGDYRNWEAITAWAEEIAQALKQETP